MTVVNFPLAPKRPPEGGWQTAEVQRLMNACAAHLPHVNASGWEFGETERGDPQLYLLGPAPEHDCVLSISRLGRMYILEDGNGRIMFEDDNLLLFAETATASLRKQRQAIIAQIGLAWCALREFYAEKIEPAMAEPMELISHLAPPLAAFA